MSFFGELRRRNVFRVSIAYLVVAWLVMQVVDVVNEPLSLPDWFDTVVILLFAIGLPIALMLSWAYEMTPEGLKKSHEVPSAESTTKITGRRLDFVIIAVLLLAVGFLVVDNYVLQGPTGSPVSADDRPSIAVLPLENLSPDPENAFFADGIHGELLTQLSKIGSLKVISRTSVMGYRDTSKNMREIGRELGVATILEGDVRRAGDTVRINVQLIDAGTDEHLWAEIYDRALTAENLLAIQTQMAASIAEALQGTLLPDEIARLSDVPTQNTRAYDFYLSGRQYRSGDPTTAGLAAQQYQLAVEEDPRFALAWARLSSAHFDLYLQNVDRSDQRRMLALSTADRALELQPDLPEAHLARANYYTVIVPDRDQALRHLAIAEQGMPGDPGVIGNKAFFYRRRGEWDQALENFERALELDPRNGLFLVNGAGDTQEMLRNYDQAEGYFSRMLEIQPDVPAYIRKAQIPLHRDGDVSALRAAAEDPPFNLGDQQQGVGWLAAIYERDYRTALEYLGELDGDDLALLGFSVPKSSLYGVTHALAGQSERAERYFRIAESQLEEALEAAPDDHVLLIAHGEILTGLGDSEGAISQARRAMELMPVSLDALEGQFVSKDAIVRVFIPAGAHELAIEELDAYLSAPGQWSIEGLLPDPRLDPIRDDPRFKELVEKYAR